MNHIGKRIIKALTKEQIVKLFDTTFNILNSQKKEDILKALDSDTSDTLSKIFSINNKEEIVSSGKNIEKWRKLWGEWEDHSSDIGDEEGKYSYQENHWEEPYFDGDTLSEDLEEVSKKMYPLIDEIYAAKIEEEHIFITAIEAIEDNMRSYPEWMQEPEEFYLESNTTKCLLKWEFLDAESSVDFLNKTISLESQFNVTTLNERAFIGFFTSLPDAIKKEIYNHLTAVKNDSKWEDKLSTASSRWHKLYHSLSKNFNPDTYLNTCHKMLNDNWKYGMPLIDDFLKKGEDQKAENVIKDTFASLLKQKWNPKETLLINIVGCHPEDKGIIDQLLKKWIDITNSMPLKFQKTIFNYPYDWDAVTNSYFEIKKSDSKKIADKLIKDWCRFTSKHNLSYIRFGDKIQDYWIDWLLEIGLNETWDKGIFAGKVKQWLEKFSKEEEPPLFILTNDLLEIYGFKNKYPALYDNISTYGGNEINKSRQTWLSKINGEELFPYVLECWKKNVENIIPDPASAHKSDYTQHAEWLFVASELDSNVYNGIVSKWKVTHKMRRNLWKAIKKRNLPI